MVIKIGSLVLCHLIVAGTANNAQNQDGPVIKKVPGIVKEISEGEEIEMATKDYAVKKKKYMLIVEPEEKDQIFKVNANACRPVVDEETHDKLTKEKKEKSSKKTKDSVDEKSDKNKESSPKENNKASDSEKEELLKELE